MTEPLNFKPLQISDRETIQAITLNSGLRNCNLTFTNLWGWKFMFNTEFCITSDWLILRYKHQNHLAYIICSALLPNINLVNLLKADAKQNGCDVVIMGMDDNYAQAMKDLLGNDVTVTPQRNNCDYIYLRSDLQTLYGKNLKAKRNHVNKFLSEHPNYVYKPLTPDLFQECLKLEKKWRDNSEHENPAYADTIAAEQQVMERVFSHWQQLDAQGGCIFVENNMVAFSYGAPVSTDTFDVCVEKADRNTDGAFNIINQQLVTHLPEQYVYINREEDMGLAGLRKAKLSYHPHLLLPFNTASFSA